MTRTVFKLTMCAPRFYTRVQTDWGENVTHSAPGEGPLCTAGWIHCYDNPILAVVMRPEHTDPRYNVLWLAEAQGRTVFDGIKRGVQRLTTIRRMPMPEVSSEQRTALAILAACHVCTDTTWRTWAEGWLAGVDRTYASAATAWMDIRRAATGLGPLGANSAAQAADAAAYNGPCGVVEDVPARCFASAARTLQATITAKQPVDWLNIIPWAMTLGDLTGV